MRSTSERDLTSRGVVAVSDCVLADNELVFVGYSGI